MAIESRRQTQTNPSVDRFKYHARDTGSDPHWGWFGSGTETRLWMVRCKRP